MIRQDKVMIIILGNILKPICEELESFHFLGLSTVPVNKCRHVRNCDKVKNFTCIKSANHFYMEFNINVIVINLSIQNVLYLYSTPLSR